MDYKFDPEVEMAKLEKARRKIGQLRQELKQITVNERLADEAESRQSHRGTPASQSGTQGS